MTVVDHPSGLLLPPVDELPKHIEDLIRAHDEGIEQASAAIDEMRRRRALLDSMHLLATELADTGQATLHTQDGAVVRVTTVQPVPDTAAELEDRVQAEAAETKPGSTGERVVELLRERGPLSTTELVAVIGGRSHTIRDAALALVRRGVLEDRGKFLARKGAAGRPPRIYAVAGDERKHGGEQAVPAATQQQAASAATGPSLSDEVLALLLEHGPLTGPEMFRMLRPGDKLNSSVTEAAKKLVKRGSVENLGPRPDLKARPNAEAPNLFALTGEQRSRPIKDKAEPAKPAQAPPPAAAAPPKPAKKLTQRQEELDAATLKALEEMGERNLGGVAGRLGDRDQPKIMRSLERHIAAGRVEHRQTMHGTTFRIAGSEPNEAYDQRRNEPVHDAGAKWRRIKDEKNADIKHAVLSAVTGAAPDALTMEQIVLAYQGDRTADDVREEVRRLWRNKELQRNADGYRIGLKGKLSYAAMTEALGIDMTAQVGETERDAA